MKTVIRSETEMKDSGLRWLGEIPNDWKVSRVGNFFSFSSGDSLTNENIRNEGMYLVYGANGIRGYYSKYNLDKKRILLGRVGALAGNVHIVDGKVWVTEHALIASNKLDLVEEYYGYVFESMNLIQYSKSSAQPVISGDTLQKLRFPVPKLPEQQAIANYLDKTCSKIDEIIAEAKASIDEYKELKISQINKYTVHTMKRTKLKYITEKIGDGIHATPEYSDEGTIRFINGGSFGEDSIKMIGPMLSNEEYQKQNKSLLNEHTVMIALNGANFGNTSLYNNEAILLGKSAGYITLKPTVCREYVRYCLENSVTKEAFDLSLNGTTIPNLSLNTLRNTEICLPDYSVQKQLAKTIKKMIIKMDSLISEKESLINDLEAYKKSLIYEVVTGKRRVV